MVNFLQPIKKWKKRCKKGVQKDFDIWYIINFQNVSYVQNIVLRVTYDLCFDNVNVTLALCCIALFWRTFARLSKCSFLASESFLILLSRNSSSCNRSFSAEMKKWEKYSNYVVGHSNIVIIITHHHLLESFFWRNCILVEHKR